MTAKNNEGDNAYNLAILYGHTELARYLDESGCDTAENSLRQSRKASTDEWLAMAVRRTPSNTEISKMREKVHKNYSALEKEKTKAGKGTPPAQSTEDMAASAAAVEAATGLEGEEAAKHMDAGAPVGQISFPVGQRVVKKAPHACRLGIGSMGLAMFDGVVPVATWPYKYIDAVVVQSGSKSSKVVLMLNSGKMRKIAFQTLRPDELAAAIESKMDELAMHQATSPTWTPRMGDARVSHGGAMSPEPEPEPEPELDSSPTGSDSKITLDDDRSIWVSHLSALFFPMRALPIQSFQLGSGDAVVHTSSSATAHHLVSSPTSCHQVGGIPESLIVMDMTASEDEIDIESSPLAKLFAGFGAIVSLTTRQKPGLNRSWAFITFENAASVEKALKAKPVKHGSVQLEIKKADVEEQLQRSETGALADVWRRQQEKEMKWMQSLLHGMHNDESYKAAKARVGAAMGLRPEEIGAWRRGLVCIYPGRHCLMRVLFASCHAPLLNRPRRCCAAACAQTKCWRCRRWKNSGAVLLVSQQERRSPRRRKAPSSHCRLPRSLSPWISQTVTKRTVMIRPNRPRAHLQTHLQTPTFRTWIHSIQRRLSRAVKSLQVRTRLRHRQHSHHRFCLCCLI